MIPPPKFRMAEVPDPPGAKLADVVQGDVLERLGCLRAFDEELAHVAGVEYPGPAADRLMLLDDAGELHRHLPPAERDQPAAMSGVNGMQRGPAE